MRTLAAFLAFVIGILGVAGMSGYTWGHLPVTPWTVHFLIGIGLGALLMLCAINDPKPTEKRAPSTPMKRVYSVPGSTCPDCHRPLLAGMKKCPFCYPTVPQESKFEQTLHYDYEEDNQPVAMPGLAAATRMMLETGALGFMHVFEGGNKGQSILLSTGTVSVGRSKENTVILEDGGVSQKHFQIQPQGRGYLVRDADSKNGTFVNDQRVGTHRLQSGDVIAIGETRFIVHLR